VETAPATTLVYDIGLGCEITSKILEILLGIPPFLGCVDLIPFYPLLD
jgi:hypothetical protein